MRHFETTDRVAKDMLRKLVDEQQKAEQRMAREVADAINADLSVMGCLRGMVANALEDIEWITLNAGDAPFKEALCKDAINYPWVREMYGIADRKTATETEQQIALGHHAGDFRRFLTDKQGVRAYSMNAFKCADMIRFYGEVLEACQYSFRPRGKVLEGLTESQKEVLRFADKQVGRAKDHQQGPRAQWAKKGKDAERGRTFGNLGVTKDKKHWDDTRWSTPPRPTPPRVTDLSDKGRKEHAKEFARYAQDLKDYEITCEFVKRRTTSELRIAKMRGGASLWVQTPKDRVAKVDKTFGLAHAATISGTTTDNIFFYNRMSLVGKYLESGFTWNADCMSAHNRTKFRAFLDDCYAHREPGVRGPALSNDFNWRNRIIDPVFYIIPLGAIVGAGHHSTIECAFPLALNGIVDYTIKNYGSLFPTNRGERNVGGGTGIKSVMESYEKRRGNRRFLIYYDSSGEYEGYVDFEWGRDDDVWRQVARADQTMLNRFAAFSQYPTKEQVASLHRDVKRAMMPAPNAPKRPRPGDLGTAEQKEAFKSARDKWVEREQQTQ
jgi:hypothetical protein